MTTFDDRKDAFEKRFAHDAQQDFALEARMSKLYGLWAANELGITDGAEANLYAMSVVEANLEEAGFDDILRKVRADFDVKGLDISDHIMIAELENAMDEAQKQKAAES